jgi:hypothetical protein
MNPFSAFGPRFLVSLLLGVFLLVCLLGTSRLLPTPFGAVAAVSGESMVVVLRSRTMPKPGHVAHLYVFGPGERQKTIGTVTRIIGSQVTVKLTAPFTRPKFKIMVLFEDDHFAARLKPSLKIPEPIRHPLKATEPAEQDLIRAATTDDVETTNTALGEIINIDASDADGSWPLAIAARHGHTNVAELLLRHGADPNLIDQNTGLTPLKLAASWGREEAARLLIEHGADANFQGPMNNKWNKGWSPLQHAASGEHVEVVNVLLDMDANPNLQNAIGDTALHSAAEKGRVEIFKILLEAGGNPTLKNDEGQIALDLVSSIKRNQFEAALLKSKPSP